jgi:Ribonuclease G/E
MVVARILKETAIGETRYAAFDGSGRAVAVRLDRWSDQAHRLQLGDIREARIRAIHDRQGGAFVEVFGGAEAFVRLNEGHGLTEGQMISVRIVSEARSDKLARAQQIQSESTDTSPATRWQTALKGGGQIAPVDVPVGNPEVEAAFDEAISEHITLTGGGILHIQPTSALVAVDLDTSGRNDSGRAASRALRINLEAAQETARQVSLRNLGGAVVLDCVAPINREAGLKVRDGFLAAFSSVSTRTVKALPPSIFGLMEASVEWGETPIADRMLAANGEQTDETLCLHGLRHLQREARAQPMARLTLALPARAMDWMASSGLDLQRYLDETFGARLTIQSHTRTKPEVFAT